ncbi:MBL fold metallo-hydrolase [Paenibacillus thailandensis]|uniref:MBL fold metallo-hydrolase n=1 Tax=Paenibacillus thailandensis TaxID=393250 RepID=A0ABW5R242_9BACL
MIEIKPFGSSSAGNCYKVTDGETVLLLEAGLRFKDIQRGLQFRMSSIAACLISHGHGDHVKAAKDIMKAGIDVYTSQGTIDAAGLAGHRAVPIEALKPFTIGTWTILPFDIQHDVEEPLGFLMANKAGDKLLFATDTWYIRHTFTGLTHLLIECNYSMRILDENIAAGRVPVAMKKRLIRSHFSLENLKDFIRANDMSKVQEIWLIHLSDTNSDEALFKREIQELTGRPVYVAGR